MLVMALDLEFNQPSQRVIQIGVVVGDIVTGEVKGRWSSYVQPGESLAPFITTLTGISDNDLVGAPSVQDAYEELLRFYESHGAFYTILTWGGGDTEALRRQLSDTTKWPFGRRWLDAKSLYQFRQLVRGEKPQAGLAKALTRSGLQFQGRKHTAEDDAFNTFRIAHELCKPLAR